MYSTNSTTAIRRAVVKFEYNATEDNQLSIAKGEEIDLLSEVTSEGWVLARNNNNEEGYIPDKYFEITAASPAGNKVGGAGRPPRPPPLPSGTASPQSGRTTSGPRKDNTNNAAKSSGPPSWVHDQNNNNTSSGKGGRNKSGSLMEEGDEYGLFAYQYEWFAIISLYIGGILSFLYSTTQPDTYRVYFIILGIVSTLVTTLIMGIVSQFRTSCNMCGCGTIGLRGGLFIFNAILLIPSPIGASVVAIGFIAAVIEFQVIKKDVKELPAHVTDEWGNQICGNGGLPACSLGKLITFFTILAINIGSLGYGFSDGYNYSIDRTEEISTDYYLNPGWTGMMYGFGRVITISMVILLFSSLFGCCSRQERNIRAKRKEESCCGKIIMAYSDVENRRFFHRCLGYSIVWATFLHIIASYYSYEDSSSTHSFYDIYGWWIIASGAACLLLLSVIVASANDTVADQSPKFFLLTHRFLGAFLAFFLIFHGSNAFIVNQYYWMFILAPLLLYSCDALYRYARQDM